MSRRKMTARQRKNKRQNKSKNKAISVQRNRFQFLDPEMLITFKYTDEIDIGTVAGTGVSIQQFRLNSLFDPDLTNAGHQPYGFDQMAALYNRYRVLWTKWKFVVTTGSSIPLRCVCVPTNDVLATTITNLASFNHACEIPMAKTYTYGGLTCPAVNMRGSIRLHTLAGVTPREYTDDRFSALVSANPTEILLLTAAYYNPGGTAASIIAVYELEYRVVLSDPVQLVQS